jgi:hypothetical protein
VDDFSFDLQLKTASESSSIIFSLGFGTLVANFFNIKVVIIGIPGLKNFVTCLKLYF